MTSAVESLIDPQLLDSTSICIRDLKQGKELFSLNCSLPLKPASVMKLATSSAALRHLGGDYTWKTKVSIGVIRAGKSEFVTVDGVGDPSITTESLWLLARKIRKAGVESLESIVLNNGSFLDQKARVGSRAYEGGSSSLAFNFNSIGFEICPTSSGLLAQAVSDPWEAGQKIRNLVKTSQRQGESISIEDESICDDRACKYNYTLGGTIAQDSPCIQVYRSVEHPEQYFGVVLRQFLQQLGVRGKMEIVQRKESSPSNLSFVHASKSLREVLFGLNNFSTNVTAEQLVYSLGNDSNDRLSFGSGLVRIAKHLESLGVPQSSITLKDGSGLSHENRLTGGSLVALLASEYGDIRTGLDFQGSLAVWGRSGTLKNRRAIPGSVVVRGKTGSLDGVSSLAGYMYRESGEVYAFAILQNRVASKAKAVDIEDEIVEYLAAF